jgi:hypothetical protein
MLCEVDRATYFSNLILSVDNFKSSVNIIIVIIHIIAIRKEANTWVAEHAALKRQRKPQQKQRRLQRNNVN